MRPKHHPNGPQVIDSPHRCPFDGKRMIMEPYDWDQTLNKHSCWDCGYVYSV